jgi:hypothetical protein
MRTAVRVSSRRRQPRRLRAVRAWVAEGRVDRDRRQVAEGKRPALVIFSVSVHESVSTAIEDRLTLMSEVAARFSQRVPSGVPSVWVFPGGYFGFDAARRLMANSDS